MYKSEVIRHYGNGAAAGRAIGVTRQAVSAWPELIPELHARRYHEATDGELKFDRTLYEVDRIAS